MSIEWALLAAGLLCLAVALVVGGLEERTFATAQAVSIAFEITFARSGDVDIAVIIDLAVLAIILPIALRTHKAWPLVAASVCVATLMSEAAQYAVHASPDAYGLMQGGWDLVANIVVAIGAARLWRARRAECGAARQSR